MTQYEEIYQDLCARYSTEEVQNFFDTVERRVRERVAMEVILKVDPKAKFVVAPISGKAEDVRNATLAEVENMLRERAAASPATNRSKSATTGRVVFNVAAELVSDKRTDQ